MTTSQNKQLMNTRKKASLNQHHAYIMLYSALTVAFCLLGVHIFKISILQNMLLLIHGLIIGIMIFTLTVLYHTTEQKFSNGKEHTILYFEFPLALFAIIFTLSNVINAMNHIEIINDVFINHQALTFNNYNNHMIIDGWEDKSMIEPELNTMYQHTFKLKTSSTSPFLSKQAWQKKHPNIPYVTFEGHELQWHYAAKFIQQMISFSRLFSLEEQFPIDRKKTSSDFFYSEYAGWITNFRMFLKNDIVRNVWEQTAKFYATPSFIEWVKFHITDVIDNDPYFFRKHKKKWTEATLNIIKKNLDDAKNTTLFYRITNIE